MYLFGLEFVRECPKNAIRIFHYAFFTFLSFAAFIIWNGSIVFGDKEAHPITVNIHQVLIYVIIFGMLCGKSINFRLSTTTTCIVAFLYSYLVPISVHPYNLIDNGHYVFHVIKFIQQNRITYSVTAALAAGQLCTQINEEKELLKIFLYLGAATSSIAFSSLIEFRYFVIPLAMFQLTFKKSHVTKEEVKRVILIDLVLIGLFLFKQHQKYIW